MQVRFFGFDKMHIIFYFTFALQPLLFDGPLRGLLGLGAGLPAGILHGVRLLPQLLRRQEANS